MEIYVVGGAVRDVLLNKNPKDMDYVVCGATEDVMINLGFKQVGADFPVYLHPDNGNEYALARRERKVGVGYIGFEADIEDVTLEEDTARRDLTINSLAVREQDWEEFAETRNVSLVIDYHNGLNDLINHVFRNVTEAFREDPVRVLRLARFSARFGDGWSVDDSTVAMIRQMNDEGDFFHLTRERVWQETSNALMEPHAYLFIKNLLKWEVLHNAFGGNGDIGCHGPIASFTPDFEYGRLKTACEQGASLAVRLAMAGFNHHDVRQIKGDTDIVKFIRALYAVTLHLSDLHDGEEVVRIFNSVNAYQNEKNFKWLLEAISVLHGTGAGDLFKILQELSGKYGFEQLDDETKTGNPKLFSTAIDTMRAKVITVYCSDAIEVIREGHPKWVAEAEQE